MLKRLFAMDCFYYISSILLGLGIVLVSQESATWRSQPVVVAPVIQAAGAPVMSIIIQRQTGIPE
jgi:hypothetical protein